MNSIEGAASASGMAAAGAALKAAGGLASALAVGAGLAAVVVMCMTPPRSKREWVVGIICTVIGSVGGGAFVIENWELQRWMNTSTGLLSTLGLVFACGLPAWAVVRWTFAFIEKRKSSDISEILNEIRKGAGRNRKSK